MNINKVIKKSRHITLNTIVWILVIGVNFPLIWMILTSIKQREEVYLYPPILITKNPTMDSFIRLFEYSNFERYFLNSVIVSFSAVLVTIIIAVLTSYVLTRYKFKGRGLLSRAYILVYLIPQVVLTIPIFIIMKRLHINDSLVSLVVAYLIFTFPYCYLMLRSYIGSISPSLEEAAMIDGSTRFGAFRRIIIPVAMPGIISTSIFSAILSWNEYLFALVLISNDNNRTLTIGTANLIEQVSLPDWGLLMAAGLVVTIPMLIFFVIIQRNLVTGLSAGALKE